MGAAVFAAVMLMAMTIYGAFEYYMERTGKWKE
jgi:hypothetical protein